MYLHFTGVCSCSQGWCWDSAVLPGMQDPARTCRGPCRTASPVQGRMGGVAL